MTVEGSWGGSSCVAHQQPRLVLGWILGAALDHDQWYQLRGKKRDHLEVSCHLHGAVAGISCGHLACDLILSQRTVYVWTEGCTGWHTEQRVPPVTLGMTGRRS